jgi:hypothetical protein
MSKFKLGAPPWGSYAVCSNFVETLSRRASDMNSESNDTVATLRVELEGIEPLIWRRVSVRTSINLIALHEVIQAVTGWDDRHLWMLTAKDYSYGVLIPDDDDWNKRIKNAATTALSQILSDGLKGLSYIYDFGDGWQHRIVVGDIKRAEPRTAYPRS